VHGSIDSDEIEGAQVIHTDLLDDGPLVRHHQARLASTVLDLCS